MRPPARGSCSLLGVPFNVCAVRKAPSPIGQSSTTSERSWRKHSVRPPLNNWRMTLPAKTCVDLGLLSHALRLVMMCTIAVHGIGCAFAQRIQPLPRQALNASTAMVLTSFEGTSGPGYKDHPDTSGGVGPDHIVDFVGSAFTVRDKTTGTVLEQMSQTDFWASAGLTPGTLNDPRIIYDPIMGRWLAVTAGPFDLLAISADSDPTHAWKGVTLSTAVSGDLLPRIGIDANGVYVCSYGGSSNTICFAIPQSDLQWVGTSDPLLNRMVTFRSLPFEMMPAIDLNAGKAITAPEILLTRKSPQTGIGVPVTLLMKQVTWAGGIAKISPTITTPTSLTFTTPATAAQPGGPPIKGKEDHRFLDVFASGNSVFAALGSEIGGRIGMEWFEVDAGSGALVQSGILADPTYDILFPTITADSNGNVAVGFTQSSATEFPSVAIVSRGPTDAPGTLGDPVVVAPGTSSYFCTLKPVGWGTYSTTIQDPVNPLILWTYQEYGNSNIACQWSTRWVSFSL